MAPPSPSNDSQIARDLGAVLNELGLSSQGEPSGGSLSIRESLEAFINTMMGALQQQQEQQLALQQQQRQARQEERKQAQGDGGVSPLRRDLERMIEGLQQGEQGDGGQALTSLQRQLSQVLESRGAADSGITLKEVLTGLASKLPTEPAEQKGYRVDAKV